MKGTALICCFLSLLLLQATAGESPGKHFGQTLYGSCLRSGTPWAGEMFMHNGADEWKSDVV